MLLTKVDLGVIGRSHKRRTKLQGIIEEFENMNCPAVECDISEYSSVSSAAGSLRKAIEAMHKDSIIVVVSNGHVYMINTILAKGATA